MLDFHEIAGQRGKPLQIPVVRFVEPPVIRQEGIRKRTAIQYRDIVATFVRMRQIRIRATKDTTHSHGLSLKQHLASDLTSRRSLQAMFQRFAITHTAPRNVPACSKKTVVSAREQQPSGFVRYQQIDVGERHQRGDQKKQCFRQPLAPIHMRAAQTLDCMLQLMRKLAHLLSFPPAMICPSLRTHSSGKILHSNHSFHKASENTSF